VKRLITIAVALFLACLCVACGGRSNTGGGLLFADAGTVASDSAAVGADGSAAAVDAGGASAGVDTADGLTALDKYKAKCAGCHGTKGQGSMLGYELRHPVRAYYRWVIRNGRPGVEFDGNAMPAFADKDFSDAELETLFDWLDSFAKPTDGKGLYADYCASCHGPKAKGGVAGEGIRKSGAKVPWFIGVVRKGHGGQNYAKRKKYMPAWTASELTDAEITLIAAALTSL
jgi:mono/diheme cytochrome c family protein